MGALALATVAALAIGVGTVPQASASHDVPAPLPGSSSNVGMSPDQSEVATLRVSATSPTATTGTTGTTTAPRKVTVGTQFHGVWSSYDNTERAAVLDKLKRMGARWVRIDMSWATLQPTSRTSYDMAWGVPFMDRIIKMANDRGLRVLGMLWLTPDWAQPTNGPRSSPANPADYGRALAWAAKRWQGKVQSWEVWNEPNSSDFWITESPVQYTRLLCAGFNAVQRSGSTAGIVFGGTVHNDVEWISRAYDAGAKGCFDRMATHPYVGPANASPASGGENDPWDFNRLAAVRQLMLSHGDRRPIWLTEFGWSSHANTGTEKPWNRGVTEAQQASYTVSALKLLRERHPYVTAAFIYNEREKETSDVHQNGYGIMRKDTSPKPVYNAVKQYVLQAP
jgi:polysaccharide biosynthesis protein PslG